MRVLIIEDEDDLRDGLAQSLRENGYAVDEAADGQTGLHKATDNPYDAVVLDVMLPRLNGWEVLRLLRRHSRAVPVLMLTARDAIDDRVRGLDGGADDYLVKPFALAELLARVRALARRGAGVANPVIEAGALRIDTAARAVTYHGHAVSLTGREYALLEMLALHRGRVLSRTELYNHLFDETDDSLSNLLDVYVCNLRRKLGAEVIATRRGQGYVLHV